MLDIEMLREVMDLPAGYKPDAPQEERIAVLKNALAETRLSNALQGRVARKRMPPKARKMSPKSKPPTGLSSWGSDRARITRCIQVYGPTTAREVANILGFEIRRSQQNISQLAKDGYIKRTGETRNVNGHKIQVFGVTPSGIKYGAIR